jgi:hypothetical protein
MLFAVYHFNAIRVMPYHPSCEEQMGRLASFLQPSEHQMRIEKIPQTSWACLAPISLRPLSQGRLPLQRMHLLPQGTPF